MPTISIFFCETDVTKPPGKSGNCVVIFPTSDKWNDFTFRSRFKYNIFKDGKSVFSGDCYLSFLYSDGFLETSSPNAFIVSKIGKNKISKSYLTENDLPKFYTMLFDFSAYRLIVKTIGSAAANEYLSSMCDLVALQKRDPNNKILVSAQETSQFKLSFMRDSQTFFAFHGAKSLLDGSENESFSEMSTEIIAKFKLDRFDSPHVISINFNDSDFIPARISVIIGENGVGKSQTLSAIAKSLLNGTKELEGPENSRPKVNRLLAVSGPGETHLTFPQSSREDRIPYSHITLNHSAQHDRDGGMGNAIVKLSRSTDEIGGRTRWKIFRKAINSIYPISDIYFPLKDNVSDHSNTTETDRSVALSELGQDGSGERRLLEIWGSIKSHGEPFQLINNVRIPFSSGQMSFMRFCVHACLHIDNGTLVLIDEPETHLHPKFITDFMLVLDNLLKSTGSRAIIATHSVYLVREVTRSQVIILRSTSHNTIEAVKPRLQTLGSDVGEISQFVFGDTGSGSIVRNIIEYIRNNPDRKNEILQSVKSEISLEAWVHISNSFDIPNPDEGDKN